MLRVMLTFCYGSWQCKPISEIPSKVSLGSSLFKNSARVLLARFSLNSKNGRPNKNNILLIYGF
jgi:hypothetical protein